MVRVKSFLAGGVILLTILGAASFTAAAHQGSGIVVDAQGNVFFQDSAARTIWKIDPQGKVTAHHDKLGGHWMALDAKGKFARVDLKLVEWLAPALIVADGGAPITVNSDGNLYYGLDVASTGQDHTDWAAVDRKYRPQVTAATTPEELFGILREMILPFHNAHTNINAASINRQYVGYKPVLEIGLKLQATSSLSIKEILDLFNQQAQRTRDIIESKYSDGRLRSYCNDMIHFGMLRNSIGYLRILGFDGYTKEGGFEQGATSLEAALDDIFKGAGQMNGLIIDVRVNTGGADPYCLAIASRLTHAKYLAYSKVTRDSLSGPLHFTAPQPAWVDVSTRPGYHGKVVLLIGPDTLSGGETFAMALMGRKPHVTFVGENTQGVFSDVFGHKLPNGWTFGLPNELYLTRAGKSFDGQGVPPDIRVPVYPKADLESGRDGALEKALEALGKR